MTVGTRFMIIQSLSFEIVTRSIHLFDCDPHEQPGPSALLSMRLSAVPRCITRQALRVDAGASAVQLWSHRDDGVTRDADLMPFDVERSGNWCSGELIGFLNFPATLTRISLFSPIVLWMCGRR